MNSFLDKLDVQLADYIYNNYNDMLFLGDYSIYKSTVETGSADVILASCYTYVFDSDIPYDEFKNVTFDDTYFLLEKLNDNSLRIAELDLY